MKSVDVLHEDFFLMEFSEVYLSMLNMEVIAFLVMEVDNWEKLNEINATMTVLF